MCIRIHCECIHLGDIMALMAAGNVLRNEANTIREESGSMINHIFFF